jgi:alpha-galactosidase
MQKDYETMRDALANCGRDIVYSICAWEFRSWMPETGNLWRTTTDILNHWKKEGSDWSWGILDIVDLNEPLANYAKPGAWNDPDMLQVGNFGGNRSPNETEYRSHMSLWCIMAAPIIMGNDIRNMNQVTKDILLNKEIIAVNQDSAGIQGTKIKSTNGLDVWCKPLGSKDGDTKAVALFNRNGNARDITVDFEDIGLSGEVLVRDLWAKEDKGEFTDSYTMSVPPHGTAMLKINNKPTVKMLARQKESVLFRNYTTTFSNGNIIVSSVDNARQFSVSIFLPNGRQIALRHGSTGTVTIPAGNGGIYIIHITCNGHQLTKKVSIF